jgi:hypothetical protein
LPTRCSKNVAAGIIDIVSAASISCCRRCHVKPSFQST